jgi:hypothetical protein
MSALISEELMIFFGSLLKLEGDWKVTDLKVEFVKGFLLSAGGVRVTHFVKSLNS